VAVFFLNFQSLPPHLVFNHLVPSVSGTWLSRICSDCLLFYDLCPPPVPETILRRSIVRYYCSSIIAKYHGCAPSNYRIATRQLCVLPSSAKERCKPCGAGERVTCCESKLEGKIYALFLHKTERAMRYHRLVLKFMTQVRILLHLLG